MSDHAKQSGRNTTIMVNGKQREVADGITLAALIEDLGLDRARVAAEVNLEVVRRAEHGTRVLVNGDRVEIVTFVGGG